MSKPKITVDIATDGSAKVSVKGVAGASCVDLTQDLERALGAEVERKKTRDFAKPAEARAQLKARG